MRTPRWSAGRSVRQWVRSSPSNRLLAALAVVIVPVAVTGCAAGQRAQTANEFSVVDGASADIGKMGVRNAGLTAPPAPAGYAKGEKATLSMTVINNGTSPDTLTSVTTSNASRVTLTAAPTAASPSTTTATGISVPANGAVVVGPGAGAAKITLAGLTAGLVPGQLVTVTMNFQVAGQVSVQLPVKLVPGQTGGETVNVSPPTEAGA